MQWTDGEIIFACDSVRLYNANFSVAQCTQSSCHDGISRYITYSLRIFWNLWTLHLQVWVPFLERKELLFTCDLKFCVRNMRHDISQKSARMLINPSNLYSCISDCRTGNPEECETAKISATTDVYCWEYNASQLIDTLIEQHIIPIWNTHRSQIFIIPL